MTEHEKLEKAVEKLKKLGACSEALDWLSRQESIKQAWRDCHQGDWMAWVIHRTGANGKPWSKLRRPYVLAMCECARLLLKYIPEGETRPLRCIEVHEAWANGKRISLKKRYEAAWAAETAWAAWAVWVARAVRAAGAARAAWKAGTVWAAWAAGAARAAAGIVRKYYPKSPEVL